MILQGSWPWSFALGVEWGIPAPLRAAKGQCLNFAFAFLIRPCKTTDELQPASPRVEILGL
jgi:hypothetical protein